MIHTIETASRIIHSSNPELRIKKVASDLAQVFSEPGVVGLVANLYKSLASVRLFPKSEDPTTTSWREVSYDDPAFEKKLKQYLAVRLQYSPEDRMRFYRQEEVKRYFEVKRRTHKFAGDAE